MAVRDPPSPAPVCAARLVLLTSPIQVLSDRLLGAYIPWLGPQESLARVTLRQALNHTGGLIRDGTEADYWQLDDAFPDVEGLRRLMAEGGAALDANETFKYSNIGYALLGMVVEAASGLPYNAY